MSQPAGEGIEIPGEAKPNYEEAARSKGWRPKEEFEGDQSSWVDAEEFIKREPLFEKIRSQSKEVRELRKTVESMANHYHKQVEASVKRELTALQNKRRDAIELGDVKKVEEIDQQIEETKQEAAVTAKEEKSEVPEEITTWIEENKWYKDNEDMREFAVAYNLQYLKRNPGQLTESLVKTAEAVKRAFPEEYEKSQGGNKKRSTPPQVEAPDGAASSGGKKSYSVSRLSEEQKLVYKQMVTTHKVLSHDEYFKSLEEIGELR